MVSNPSPMNILDYCNGFINGSIKVDSNYQRTDKVWPEKAKQYLIETIIMGYPVPKFFLHQKIDTKSKKSTKFVVDGQQRSKAILDFFQGKFPLASSTINPELSSKFYDSLAEEYQNLFLSYALPIDLFVTASREEIIETFRRINSYTVPLNAEEKRHANHQGIMKWFIYELARNYSEKFTVIGTLTEKNLSRMVDFKFFSELVAFLDQGQIVTTNAKLLDRLYEKYDDEFPHISIVFEKLTSAFEVIFQWDWIAGLNITKPYIMQMIILSLINNENEKILLNEDKIKENFSALSEAIEVSEGHQFVEFVNAASKTTNDKNRKTVIFNFVTNAMFE
jgi:hypothetical protein